MVLNRKESLLLIKYFNTPLWGSVIGVYKEVANHIRSGKSWNI